MPTIDVGKQARAFSLPDQKGQTHALKDNLGRWVVPYFYPKDDTSGCTDQACQFQGGLPKFKKLDAVVLGVSPDPVASHGKFADKHGLRFTLLADEQRDKDNNPKVCHAYGVWQEKSMYGRKYMGVVRTTYLIDPAGKVTQRWDKVKVPGHAEEVLGVLNELRG